MGTFPLVLEELATPSAGAFCESNCTWRDSLKESIFLAAGPGLFYIIGPPSLWMAVRLYRARKKNDNFAWIVVWTVPLTLWLFQVSDILFHWSQPR